MDRTIAHTTPYSWPWDGAFDPARLALVVLSPNAGDTGASPAPEWSHVRAMAGPVRSAGGVVVHVRTTPPDRSAGRVDAAYPLEADHLLEAYGIDGFFGSPLDALLRSVGRDQLLLCGAWLETSVHSTMRSANDRGYECLLVLDACVPHDPTLVAASRSQIEMSGGIFGAVGQSADVLSAISTHERTPA
jgi:biuret amidohydrolase